ncbi:MAG: UDP-3-O-acyl-N-acetylglucosamine deacetylase [Rhodobacteraceae bacterium]|nr:UDP-3-O-acyl-N-acetylglucosamine deacetylase [Paracoccaceae bacterium]
MTQTTVRQEVSFFGAGLHTGKESQVTILPAPSDFGIQFYRTDCEGGNSCIPANFRNVVDTLRCTTLVNSMGMKVKTTEHLLAAFVACGIRNAKVLISGEEIPALDGSAREFVMKFLESGLQSQGTPQKILKVLKPVHCEDTSTGAHASFYPSDTFEMEFTIEYPLPIGKQSKRASLINGSVVSSLSSSRTFCMNGEIEYLWSNGLGLGGNYDNVAIIDEKSNKYLFPVRHEDEPVRHKMLDAVGDLSLSGYPILGLFVGYKSGHHANIEILRKLFSDKDNYEIVDAPEAISSKLPGMKAQLSDLPEI